MFWWIWLARRFLANAEYTSPRFIHDMAFSTTFFTSRFSIFTFEYTKPEVMCTIEFPCEPEGQVYSELLRFVAQRCREFRFITYDRRPPTRKTQTITAGLSGRIIAQQLVNEWPGTQLDTESWARLWRFRSDVSLAKDLIAVSSGFASWGGDLPEDPHFVREDGSVMLASTSSEEDAWLMLTADEYKDFAVVPAFEGLA